MPKISNLHVMDRKTLAFKTTTSTTTNAAALKAPTTASSFLLFDPDVPITGTASGVGTTSTLADPSLVYADSHLVGMTLWITPTTIPYKTEATAFASATRTVTFNPIPSAVTSATTYAFQGTPLQPQTSATITSTNKGAVVVNNSTVTGRPRNVVGAYRPVFSSGDAEEYIFTFEVLQSTG